MTSFFLNGFAVTGHSIDGKATCWATDSSMTTPVDLRKTTFWWVMSLPVTAHAYLPALTAFSADMPSFTAGRRGRSLRSFRRKGCPLKGDRGRSGFETFFFSPV